MFSVSEGKPYKTARLRTGKRALAAAGLVASVAAGAIAAAPAGATGSGKIYACYSDKTEALYHSKASAKCVSGFTRVSWNQQGPQGVRGPQGAQGGAGPQGAQGARGGRGAQGHQGAQGAQGAAGAVSGYTYPASGSAFRPVTMPASNASAVVASFTPTSFGFYAVNGMANVEDYGSKGGYGCLDQVVSGGGKIRSWTEPAWGVAQDTLYANLATNGILYAGPYSPIEEHCQVNSSSGVDKGGIVTNAELTGVRLSHAHFAAKPLHAKPRNRFSIPRALRSGPRAGGPARAPSETGKVR